MSYEGIPKLQRLGRFFVFAVCWLVFGLFIYSIWFLDFDVDREAWRVGQRPGRYSHFEPAITEGKLLAMTIPGYGIWRSVALGLALALVACERSDSGVPATPTGLIAGITSGESVRDLREEISRTALSWKVIEDSGLAPGDRRPRFDVYSASIDGFTHLGHFGELIVEFLNDRLMTTRFYPKEVEAYLEALANTGLNLTKKAEARVPPRTRVWVADDYRAKRYVGWMDTRLGEEKDRWISRYS